VKHIRGGPELPLKREELWTKFEGCLQTSPRPFAARDLFDALMSLEKVTHVNQLPGLGSSPRGVQERARSASEAVAVK
jgi:hypothetical protein